MARTKVQINFEELQDVVNQLEAISEYRSPHKLNQAIADCAWGHNLKLTPVMVYLRMKEAEKAGTPITMKTKSSRAASDPDDGSQPPAPKKTRTSVPKQARDSSNDPDVFFSLGEVLEPFIARGINVTGIGSLVTAEEHSDEQNRQIILAWAEIRDKAGLTKLSRKVGKAKVVDTATEISFAPVVTEPVVDTVPQQFEVTEEYPDGSPVLNQINSNDDLTPYEDAPEHDKHPDESEMAAVPDPGPGYYSHVSESGGFEGDLIGGEVSEDSGNSYYQTVQDRLEADENESLIQNEEEYQAWLHGTEPGTGDPVVSEVFDVNSQPVEVQPQSIES